MFMYCLESNKATEQMVALFEVLLLENCTNIDTTLKLTNYRVC